MLSDITVVTASPGAGQNTVAVPPTLIPPNEFWSSYLGVANPDTSLQTKITLALSMASAAIRSYTGRNLSFAKYTETFTGVGHWSSGYYSLSEYPVHEVINIGSSSGWNVLLPGTPIPINKETGTCRLISCPPGDVIFEYKAGYTALPPDLAGVLLELTRMQLGVFGVDLSVFGGVSSGGSSSIPIKGITVGQLKVDFAVNNVSTTEVVSSGSSPLDDRILDNFNYVLGNYVSPRKLFA